MFKRIPVIIFLFTGLVLFKGCSTVSYLYYHWFEPRHQTACKDFKKVLVVAFIGNE